MSMKIGEPLIINLAPTGTVPTKSMTPMVPVTHDEIVDNIAQCMELGVQIVHLHARDENERHTCDPEPYGRLIESLRKLPDGEKLVICVTTTGRHDSDFESRSRVLDLDGSARPDTASLTISSLNFARSASINEPDTVRQLAQRMREKNIKPELEVFDIGMANLVSVLAKEGLIQPPYYVNILLGNIAGAQPEPAQLSAILSALPANCIISIAGLGMFQLGANTFGLLLADGVRVGIEDNIWLDQQRTEYASNMALVERVVHLAGQLERSIMDRASVRHTLDLPAKSI
jgi:3-keto-5-aminohexanoate cleavage enzyme